MTNTPRTKPTSETADSSEESPLDPSGLVGDVLRDARSLLGEDDLEATSGPQASAEGSDLPAPQIESTDPDPGMFAESATANAIKHAESARDLGEHGPMVDLFGHAEPTADEVETTLETGHAESNEMPAKSEAAMALDALLAERVAQESDDDERPSYATATDDISRRRAAEAEHSAVEALEGLGSSPLRTTAGEVETLVPPEPPPANITADPVTVAVVSSETSVSNASAVDAPIASAESEPLVDEPTSEVVAGAPSAAVAVPALEESATPIPAKPSEVGPQKTAASPSMAIRIGAMPFQMVPSSLHRLVTITALSLAIWVPVVWTYAVFGPEFFTGAVSDAGADVREPLEPTDPAPAMFDENDVATATDPVDH
ncbi:MAG: hypothetical protein CBB69_012610 [Phycisphaera sp. TMED9]|nr:MAG: hypothetical protein CBB69_012610 [Phycisphaera sp. TMED9]